MTAYKRSFLLMLILVTTIFIGHQLYLIVYPSINESTDGEYIHLVDQYEVLKMQRLVLEQQYALAQTKNKILQYAKTMQNNQPGNLLVLNKNHKLFNSTENLFTNQLNHHPDLTYTKMLPVQIALSLDETKTFEQLEAYVSNNKPPQPQLMSQDEKFLMNSSASDYTLQLMGVRDINELTLFVATNHLKDAHVFHTYYLNKDWYVLVFGQYKNHTEALKTIDTLPNKIKELKPWIRQLSSVQKAIQLYR